LAKELDAIFQRTSAKESTGVEELFNKIGKKILDPSYVDNDHDNNPTTNEKEKKKKDSIKLQPDNKKDGNKKKKGCC